MSKYIEEPKLKKLLKEIISDQLRETSGQVALMYSSGLDSASILFSMLEIGVRPVLYSYKILGVESSDITNAVRVAEYFKLKLNITECDPKDIQEKKKLLESKGMSGRVLTACLIPTLDLLASIQEKYLFNGSVADVLAGSYKSVRIKCWKKPKSRFDELRRKQLANPNIDGTGSLSVLAGVLGIKVFYPYFDKRVIEYFMQFDFKELNQSKTKSKTWEAFKDYKDFLIPRRAQQLASGIKAFM